MRRNLHKGSLWLTLKGRDCLRVREFFLFVLRLRFIRPVSDSGVLVFSFDGRRLVVVSGLRWLPQFRFAGFCLRIMPLWCQRRLSPGLSRLRLTGISALLLCNRLSFLGFNVRWLRND
ncbi:hypothetical protein Bca4012_000263 [Brassica carinata]